MSIPSIVPSKLEESSNRQDPSLEAGRRSRSDSTKKSTSSSGSPSSSSSWRSPPISLPQFAHQNLPSSSSSMSSEGSTKLRKWASNGIKTPRGETLPLEFSPTFMSQPPPLEPFLPSPRSGGGICPTVHNLKKLAMADSMNKAMDFLAEIRKEIQSSYGVMSVQDIDQTVELFFSQHIREILNGLNTDLTKTRSKILFETFRDKFESFRAHIKSEKSPLVEICALHMRRYASSDLLNMNPILIELKKVIAAITTVNTTGIEGLETHPDAKPLDVLITILQEYSNHHLGTALSYIIFGKTENQIEVLVSLLKKWNSIDDHKMIKKIKKIMKRQVYHHTPDSQHQFKPKDILGTYIREFGMLPSLVTINSLPVQLEGYEGERDKMVRNFFSCLIGKIHDAGLKLHISVAEVDQLVDNLLTDIVTPDFLRALLNSDAIDKLVDDFREKNELPDSLRTLLSPDQVQRLVDDFLIKKVAPPSYLKTLLGLSSISSKIQAFIFFLDTFPLFKGADGILCRQKPGRAHIFFNINSTIQPIPRNCYQPITFIVYPKMSDDPQSFGFDENRPLAEITIGWTGYPVEASGQFAGGYTHLETLEVLKCEFYDTSYPKEREIIFDGLGLPKRKHSLKPTLTSKIAPESDFEALRRPSSQEADGSHRGSPPSSPSSSSSSHS